MRAALISLWSCLCLGAAASSQADLQALSAVIPDIQAGAWQKAEHELLDALNEYPRSAVLSNALGIVYEKEGRTDLAIHAYEQATQWLPSFTAAQLHLASLQASNGKCELATPVFLQASQSTSDLGALSTAGFGLAQCKAYAGAAEVFQKMHSLDPQSSAATFNLALARFENGDFNSSLEALESLPPGPEQQRPEVQFLKGNLLGVLKRPGASSALTAACHSRPQEDYCEGAAIELIREERFLDAIALLQKFSDTASASAPVLSTLGLAQFRLGRYQEAITSYTRAIEKDRALEAPREGLTFLLYMTGDLDRARSVADEGLQAPKPGFYLFYLRALVLYRESPKLWPEAVSSLDEAIKNNLRFAPAYFLRGKIRMQQGMLDAALEDFRVAIRADPAYPLPYFKMSQIFEQQGHREQAEEARNKFAALGSLREEEVLAKQAQNQLLQAAR